MTLSQTEKKAVLKRLHRIKGQIGGVEQMLESGRPIAEINRSFPFYDCARWLR